MLKSPLVSVTKSLKTVRVCMDNVLVQVVPSMMLHFSGIEARQFAGVSGTIALARLDNVSAATPSSLQLICLLSQIWLIAAVEEEKASVFSASVLVLQVNVVARFAPTLQLHQLPTSQSRQPATVAET